MRLLFLPLTFCILFFWSPFAEASDTAKFLQMAREALVIGEMAKWKGALQKAEESLQVELPKLPVEEGNRYQLFLYLLWAKYHQFQGSPPPIRKISDFEALQDLQTWITRTDQSTIHLKKAIFWLKRYNLLFLQISSRSNLQSQIKVQASLSLERDLENTLREVQIYHVLLLYAKENWKDRKQENSVVARLAEQEKKLAALQIAQSQTKQRQENLKQQQTRLSKGVTLLQESFLRSQGRLQARVTTGNVLIGVGVALMLAGLAGASVSAVLNVQINNDTTKTPNQREDALIPTYAGMGASGGVFLIGLVMIIVGPSIKPKLSERDAALLKAHQTYQAEEEGCQGCSSLLSWPPSSLQASPLLDAPKTPQATSRKMQSSRLFFSKSHTKRPRISRLLELD